MIKRLCDRCGSEIKDYDKARKVKYAVHYAGVEMFRYTEDYVQDIRDLCPECAKKLLEWIDHA